MAFTVVGAAVVLLAVTATVHSGIIKRQAPHFSGGSKVVTVTSTTIREASGVCASRIHPDVLYTHNDSGDTHRIFALSIKTGARLGTITIDGATALDWEDIACGPCAGGSGNCIYIADTGGNAGGDSNTIYRIREPSQTNDQHVHLDGVLKFSWDQHNCETVMVDNHGEVYVLSKVGANHYPKFVHLPSSAWGANHRVQVNEGVTLSIPSHGDDPVGGDISLNGKEVLVKFYGHVYYWSVPDGNYYSHLHSQQPTNLPYIHEPQGEAVCFDAQGRGYYTLSEGANPGLYYYQRTDQGGVVG